MCVCVCVQIRGENLRRKTNIELWMISEKASRNSSTIRHTFSNPRLGSDTNVQIRIAAYAS